ncbi:hypothetical protein CN918_28405 [Priestia megaterium]|nr:hypothetical protein CN918_28405 [Priestia megaterium]
MKIRTIRNLYAVTVIFYAALVIALNACFNLKPTTLTWFYGGFIVIIFIYRYIVAIKKSKQNNN